MTYSYSLRTQKADSKGGIRYILGPALKVSDGEVEAYVEETIKLAMRPYGSVIERVDGKVFRKILGIEGGVILRFHNSQGPGNYILFHSSPSLLSTEPPTKA